LAGAPRRSDGCHRAGAPCRRRARSAPSWGFDREIRTEVLRLEILAEMARVVQGHDARRMHDRERAVVDAQAPELVERAREQMARVDADDAAVRDDQRVAVTVRVLDPLQGRNDAV